MLLSAISLSGGDDSSELDTVSESESLCEPALLAVDRYDVQCAESIAAQALSSEELLAALPLGTLSRDADRPYGNAHSVYDCIHSLSDLVSVEFTSSR